MKAHLEIEMPTSCLDCPISHSAYCRTIACGITGKTISAPDCEETRLDSCPLVPIPPHGRLIDADALPTSRVEWEDIVNAPTIIPAEEA